MSKREEGICIWIHHIATGLGVIMGTVGLAGWLRRPKRGRRRMAARLPAGDFSSDPVLCLSQDPGGHLSQM